MKVKDLSYVESIMIPRILPFVNEIKACCLELSQTASTNAEIEQQKKELQAKGEVGINKNLPKKACTRPISPKITQPSPTLLPDPIKIEQNVKANKVPNTIYKTNLTEINQMKEQQKLAIKELTVQKYSDPNNQFKFGETKAGKSIEEIRKEVEEKELAQLQFNNSYYHPPPRPFGNDLELITSMKPNVSTILREDFQFRKLQSKDAQILKNYEEELRDPIEYYFWQEKMEKQDELEKLKHVNLRREQAKLSAEEAKLAYEKQREDNLLIGNMIREQNEIIKRQKQIELEIETLTKQAVVRDVIQERESKPYEAIQTVIDKKREQSEELRKQLEELRKQKKAERQQDEMIKADRIRQLKALNSVHRKHITVFDPTETAKIGLLDEMSYMEMKERLKKQKVQDNERIQLKQEEILEEKDKKKTKLQSKYESILKNRQLKKESHDQQRITRIELQEKELKEKEEYLTKQSIVWEKELKKRQEMKEKEKLQLLLEQEKILRQQQYLGVAAEQVALNREREVILAQERQFKKFVLQTEDTQELAKLVVEKEKFNKSILYRNTILEKEIKAKESEKEIQFEKKQLVKKLKEDIIYKKQMFAEGQQQHEQTKLVVMRTNPYSMNISNQLRGKASVAFRNKLLAESNQLEN